MSQSNHARPLKPAQLYNACDPAELNFNSTAELQSLDNFFGQDRAVEALRFGVEMAHQGYNIFVLGANDMGKHEMISDFLKQHNREEEQAYDWCYINNFNEPQNPLVMQLPPGKAAELQQDMQQCIEDILVTLPGVFQSAEYKARLAELGEEYNEKEQNAFHDLKEKARAKNIALVQTPTGYTLAPVANDNILTPAEFEALPEEEQEQIKKTISELKDELKKWFCTCQLS